jgi:hypothetical protein
MLIIKDAAGAFHLSQYVLGLGRPDKGFRMFVVAADALVDSR